MTLEIGAIHIALRRGIAELTTPNCHIVEAGIIAKTHNDAVVKNIKLAQKVLVRKLLHIGHYPALKLENLIKTVLNQKTRCFFTAHPASANSYNRLIFQVF